MLAVNKDSFLRAQKNKRISAEDFPRTNIDTTGLKNHSKIANFILFTQYDKIELYGSKG